MPNFIINIEEKDINETVDEFFNQWPNMFNTNEDVVKREALLWQQKWISANETPKCFIESLNLCSKSIFPNVYDMLKICATIPVTTATAERSFSTLKRLKTYLRNTISEDRLNGLVQMNIHREIDIEICEVVDRFASKNRKMEL